MDKNNHYVIHFMPDCLRFKDPQDAMIAARVVNRALAYMVGGLVTRSLSVDPTTDEEHCAETLVDGINYLFSYQAELISMAGGEGFLPFVKDGETNGADKAPNLYDDAMTK